MKTLLHTLSFVLVLCSSAAWAQEVARPKPAAAKTAAAPEKPIILAGPRTAPQRARRREAV
jgi:hypothetical protein